MTSENDQILEEMNKRHAIVNEGGKTYVLWLNKYDPELRRYTHERMGIEDIKRFYMNERVTVAGQDGKPKQMNKGDWWLSHPNARKYQGVYFAPRESKSLDSLNYLNLWEGFRVQESADGSWSLFYEHLRDNICNGNQDCFKYLLNWLAPFIHDGSFGAASRRASFNL